MKDASSEQSLGQATPRERSHVVSSAIHLLLVLAIIGTLIGWGIFGAYTVVPDPGDFNGVRGAYVITSHFPTVAYNLQSNSSIEYVVALNFSDPTGPLGCTGPYPTTIANGTWVVPCIISRSNSTLTSAWVNYIDFEFNQDLNCCQQSFLWYVSGPAGNLTAPQQGGGFFEAGLEGNYSAHVSNTVVTIPPAVPKGNVNGTLTISIGHVEFSRPYFTGGTVSLVLAILFSGYSLFRSPLVMVWKKRLARRTET